MFLNRVIRRALPIVARKNHNNINIQQTIVSFRSFSVSSSASNNDEPSSAAVASSDDYDDVPVDDFEPEIKKERMKSIIRDRKIDEFGRSYGTGRRKTSTASVLLQEGAGQVFINGRNITNYFQFHLRKHALEALEYTETAGKFDVFCSVRGGGVSGQSGAIRLGVARALEAYEPNLRPLLKSHGLLTRDARRVERKKTGQKKARKKFQWVKR